MPLRLQRILALLYVQLSFMFRKKGVLLSGGLGRHYAVARPASFELLLFQTQPAAVQVLGFVRDTLALPENLGFFQAHRKFN